MILSVSHRVKSMSSQKKSNYIPFIVSLVQGYCLLLSPIKPCSHCFLPKTTNERQHGTSKVRGDRAGSDTLAGPGSSVVAQQETETKGPVCRTQMLSLDTSKSPCSPSQARGPHKFISMGKSITHHGQQPLCQDAPPRPTAPLSQLGNHCQYKLSEHCWERVNH